MPAPEIVETLVERFRENRKSYQSPQFNETQLRREFLDPLFTALGWDVANKDGHAEAYKDVIHEDAIKIGGATKAPDYCFRVGGRRVFFLEAKKPSVNVKDDVSAAYQLRRYAWSAKLPLSILTDFEELALYDCRVKPDKADKSSVGRILFVTFDEYLERWDELASIFSKQAVLKGSFDRYAESTKLKRGTAEVDAAFLQEIESWRDSLARNFARRNDDLSQRDLNFAVQRTIDRIIFLRMCEDRGVEQYGQLQGLTNGDNVYRRLCQLFDRADERYNSGLFHFQPEKGRAEPPDELTQSLELDDKPLKEILRGLYYPDSPYEFSVLAAEILGQVYEQFLGKVIRLTAGHQAKIEDKPEVKKAGGVYYTPAYIVEYIVRNTVGKLVEGKSPKEVGKLSVLDPACGSGSFLVGAYQFLLDWHRDWYLDDGPAKHKKQIYQGRGGQWFLTTAEKKRILLNNIYGVDIDSQAVEVTKLSLLLKVLENESSENIENQLRLLHERALPDLGDNIKCGNSLIGPDFYNGQQMSLLDEEEQYRINVFDWKAEFPAIFKGKGGGFDAVIGNPPYIRIHNLVDFYPREVRHIQQAYASLNSGKVDIYVAFVEKGLTLLNRKGALGFIVPNKFFQADYGSEIRRILVDRKSLLAVVDFGSAQVFERATTYTCLLFLAGSPQDAFRLQVNSKNESPREFLTRERYEMCEASTLGADPWSLAYRLEDRLLRKILSRGHPLPHFVSLAITGVKTGANDIFTFRQIDEKPDYVIVTPEGGDEMIEIEKEILRPFCRAESLKRYNEPTAELSLLYPYELLNEKTKLLPATKMKARFPRAWEYLNRHKTRLESRQKGKLKGPSWYGLSFASDLRMFDVQKIVTPTLSPRNSFSVDSTGSLFPQGAGGGCGLVVSAEYSPHCLVGILNSRLLTFLFQQISSRFQGGWFAYEPRYLRRIPIRYDISGKYDKQYGKITDLSLSMKSLHLTVSKSVNPNTRIQATRRIAMTDSQIDQLVYELYGLTDKEVAVVEDATRQW